jgi:hypothetical protein
VYRPGGDGKGVDKLLQTQEGIDTVDKIEVLLEEHFRIGIRDTHYASIFAQIGKEYGLVDAKNYQENIYKQPHTFQDVVDTYNNRTIDTFTISGTFNKTFIDDMRNEIGTENVSAFNLVRHPTVCYALHWAPRAYFEKNTTYTRAFHKEKLIRSILCSASLTRYPDITTIKFEDYLKTGSITINGTTVDLPGGHTPYNAWITEYEKSQIPYIWTEQPEWNEKPGDSSNIPAIFAAWDNVFTSFRNASGNSQMPDNITEMMGYSPIDYHTFISQ